MGRNKRIHVIEPALLLHDKRMFQLLAYVINNKVKGITTDTEFLDRVGGDTSKSHNIGKLKSGTQHFVIADIKRACEIFNVDANFFFLEGHFTMMLPKKTKSPFEQLLVAVQAIGMEIGAFTPLEKEEIETEAIKLKRSRDIIEAEEKKKTEAEEKRRKIIEAEELRKKTNFEWI